jgi:hypothetical protein
LSDIDVELWEIKQSLDQLGFDISHRKFAPQLLKDLKTTVDQLRVTLWAIMEAENQPKNESAQTSTQFRKKLVEFRMKRLEQMLNDFAADVSRGIVEKNDSKLATLSTALKSTLQTIIRLTNQTT